MDEKRELIAYLAQCLTPERVERIDAVLRQRTRYLTVVLEDIYQAHNTSAVLRTCDCLGLQDVHIIENTNKYSISKDIVLGADNWLTLHRYRSQPDNSAEAIRKLKANGYRIVATSSHKDSCMLGDFDTGKGKAAIVIGTELTGLSDTIMKEADEYLMIPMFGFTESYNLSVSAAIIMSQLTARVRGGNTGWQLSEEEILDLKLQWYTNNIVRGDLVVKRFYEEREKK